MTSVTFAVILHLRNRCYGVDAMEGSGLDAGWISVDDEEEDDDDVCLRRGRFGGAGLVAYDALLHKRKVAL